MSRRISRSNLSAWPKFRKIAERRERSNKSMIQYKKRLIKWWVRIHKMLIQQNLQLILSGIQN
jgi:hypothetical protein